MLAPRRPSGNCAVVLLSSVSVALDKMRASDAAAKRTRASLSQAADEYLAWCFERETPPHVAELATRLGITAPRLTQAFRAAVHIAPSAYLKDAQIARARELLRDTPLPLGQVAQRCGFGTRVSFFRSFRRATGITPTQFRMRAQNSK